MTIESTIAGSWYPGTAEGIREMAGEWERSSAADASRVSAPDVLVLPHAGWAYSGRTAWRAVRLVKGAKFQRVVLLAPSHRAWIENRLVAPEADAVSTPLGEIRIDNEFVDRLALVAPVVKNSKVHLAEHATQIEYPLLQLALGGGFSIVPLVAGSLGADQMAMCARALSRMMDAETLLVVSSDFTHYGDDFSYAPYGTGGGIDVRKRVAEIAIALHNQGITLEVDEIDSILKILRQEDMVGFRPHPDKYMNRDGVTNQYWLPNIGEVTKEVYWKIIKSTKWHKQYEPWPL